MAVKPILQVPNNLLHQKSERIVDINDEIKAIANDLLDTVHNTKDPEAAGLAAPQLGVLLRMCVVRKLPYDDRPADSSNSKDYLLINPELIKVSKETVQDFEACMSIPDIYAKVTRPHKVKLKALDIMGNELKINASGYFARIIQHEIDHLDGILITDKADGKIYTEKEFDKMMYEYESE